MTKSEQEHSAARQAKSRVPIFKAVEDAAEFWDTHTLADFEDEFTPVEDIQFVVTRGEPKRALTVRLPQATVEALTRQANEKGIGPSTLVRMWILERLRQPQQR